MDSHSSIISDRQLAVDYLKNYRATRGLSQEAMAQRCGVRANTYARWERGEIRPPMLLINFTCAHENHELDREVSDAAIG